MSLVFEQTLIKPYCLLEIFIHWESQVIFLQVPSNSNTEILKRKKKAKQTRNGNNLFFEIFSGIVLSGSSSLSPSPPISLSLCLFFNLCSHSFSFSFLFWKHVLHTLRPLMRQDTDFQTLVTCSVQVKARQAVGESPGGYTDMMSTYRGMLFILNSKGGNLCQPCRVRQLLKPTDSPMEPPSALEPLSLFISNYQRFLLQ